MSEPITKVYLVKTNLESDYAHTLFFENSESQLNYFQSLTRVGCADFTYQRKDNFIRMPITFDEAIKFNYVMYQNSSFSNKWFFAFITDIKYKQDDVSDIYIQTDVMQTWMFDYEVLMSFVEREHVSDDSIGLHTYPENVQLGEYVINHITKDENLEIDHEHIVYGSTISPGELDSLYGGEYNGIFSGVAYYLGDPRERIGTELNPNFIGKTLNMFADNGKIDAISSMFLVPKFMTEDQLSNYVYNSDKPYSYSIQIPKRYGFEGYQPKNNKLKTYPYTYLLASNGNGGTAEYHYEHLGFTPTDEAHFMVYGALTPGCSIRMIPAIYKGQQTPENEGLNLGKFPQCNWATDQYTNWLTQNGVNIASSVVNAGVGAVGGAIVGGPVGATAGVIGGITGIATALNEVYKASRIPPQTYGNINCGDVVSSMGNNTFTYYNMSIKGEYAEMIDNYFTMFGYRVNALKVPNKNHRPSWWYTKTIDVNIKNKNNCVPQSDLNIIKKCYNSGITFWKASKFKNYDNDNRL